MLTHAEILETEFKWLEKVIKARIEFPKDDLRNFINSNDRNKTTSGDSSDYDLISPSLNSSSCKYALIASSMSFEERLLLILALHHHINPGFIETLFAKPTFKSIIEKDPTIFHSAGLTLRDDFGILPTGRFFIYLIGGKNISLTSEIIIKIHRKELTPIQLGLVGFVNEGITERLYSGRLVMLESDVFELITNESYHEVTNEVQNS